MIQLLCLKLTQNPKMIKILRLTLSKQPFNTMSKGFKDREYRENKKSNWIKSRLINSKTGLNKRYDFVLFVHGYGKEKPYFLTKYKGFEVSKMNYSVEYKTGLKVEVKKGMYRILLGPVVAKGNITSKELFRI